MILNNFFPDCFSRRVCSFQICRRLTHKNLPSPNVPVSVRLPSGFFWHVVSNFIANLIKITKKSIDFNNFFPDCFSRRVFSFQICRRLTHKNLPSPNGPVSVRLPSGFSWHVVSNFIANLIKITKKSIDFK